MLKIVHLSDLHLIPPGQELHGLRPDKQLEHCISHIARKHSDASCCIITGDLTHDGHPLAYAEAARQFARLPMPFHLMLGNHDDRPVFRQVFPDAPSDPNGFIQQVIDTPIGRLILLDTHERGYAEGRLCEKRLSWLKDRIEESAPAPLFLFMHHPPFRAGLKRMDAIRLLDADPLSAVIAASSNSRVRHLFVGHLHRAIAGSWRGLSYSGVRGTNHQIALDFAPKDFAPVSFETPAYGIVLIDADNVIVHFVDVPL